VRQIAHVGVSPSVNLKTIGREILFEIFQRICDHYIWRSRTDWRTYRQTDRQHT